VDYTELDRPAVIRRKASADPLPPPKAAGDMDYLDIPAFLRRQAD
jgi:cell division protein FtsZ